MRRTRCPRAISSTGDLCAAPSHRDGLGVFAARAYRRGAVIERCPVLVVSGRHLASLERSGLRGYLYEWDDDYAIALGYGSLYNHSSDPNARYETDVDEGLVVIRAVRPIRPGEEVTVSYTGAYPLDLLWFAPVE